MLITNLIFLPHQSDIVVRDVKAKWRYIRLMLYLTRDMLDAIFSFINGKLNLFDPLVGETLCQIRACRILLLKTENDHELRNDYLYRLAEKLKQIEKNLAYYDVYFSDLEGKPVKHIADEVVTKAFSLEQFFNEISCLINLKKEVIYLILSFVLSKYNLLDQSGIPRAIKYDAFAADLKISRWYAKKIIHYYQKILSEMSCKFILNLSKNLSKYRNHFNYLESLVKLSDENRVVLPCFVVSDIIFKTIINKQNSIILKVRVIDKFNQHQLFLLKILPSMNVIKVSPCTDSEFGGFNDYALVLQADMLVATSAHNCTAKNLCDTLNYFNIMNVIMANQAAHPQYSGIKLKKYRDNPFVLCDDAKQRFVAALDNEYCHYKAFAQAYGCSFENQQCLYIKHIYCSSVKDLYHKIHSIEEERSDCYRAVA